MKLLYGLLCSAVALPAFAAEVVDLSAIDRIVDEGFNHSEIATTVAHLTDRIGGRMTNSPQMRQAEAWAQERLRHWGLSNVRAEGFEFGRGWSIESSGVRMVAPRALVLRAIPIAWTPPTQGAISAPVVVAPLSDERDFEKWRGRLRGRIVLVTQPDAGSEPDKSPFRRYANDTLAQFDTYEQPKHSTVEREKLLKRGLFDARQDEFLAAEGAVAWVRKAYRDGGLLHGEGYGYASGMTPKLPGVEMAAEDYRKLARLAKTDAIPELEIVSKVRFHAEDTQAYNILADIPGKDRSAGYVMAGAHLDSWVASDGAQDNAAGSVVVMEAARILRALNVKPKRAIRFVLWSGEEQGMLGSAAYVERHIATRAALDDPQLARLPPYYTWTMRWPVTKQPGYEQLAAYFNLDNGSGKVRGIYTEGNLAVAPIFRQWLAPFASMGATAVVARPTGSTDHVMFQSVGLPGFQFIQDPLDYGSRVAHSSLDSYDHLKIPDLQQSAVILASMLLLAAERDEPLPRAPLSTLR